MVDPSVEQFQRAIQSGNAAVVRTLLQDNAAVRALVNAPIGPFGTRPVAGVTKNLPVLDVLLEYGADLNLKSEWWAGPFGILEYDCTPEQAAPLIARGADVDVFAAAHLGMFDRLRSLIDADTSLVHARGGDGKTPLHCARTAEIAEYLVERGAEIDARDVDHESTPAQYLVRAAPSVARLLVDRGAWMDIFIAVGLQDEPLITRCLREDPSALDHRIGHGLYKVAHDGSRPSTRAEIANRRGDIYRWVFDHDVTALDVAMDIGNNDIVARLMAHASPVQRFLAACSHGDRPTATAVLASRPDIVSTLSIDQMRVIAYRARANDTAAVLLMLDLGFDPLASGSDGWEPLRWAAFHGNAELVRRLLSLNPPIGVPDRSYGGTPLGNCLYGSLHGWQRRTGDFAATVRLLLEAGETIAPQMVPLGRDDVDKVLRDWLSRTESG